MPAWTVPATIIRVIDGDTIEADLDLGWHITYRAKIRLADINCPEIITPEGRAARDYVTARMVALMPADGLGHPLAAPVNVTSHALDKYGRVLGTVWTAPGVSLNDALIAAGHAVVMG